MRPEGALVAMATPFRENGAIHRGTLRKMIDFLVERGVDGIFAASSVGEFVHMSAAQRHELVGLTVEYADGRVPVLGGAADISPVRVIGHCREFKRAGASFATIAPPYYYPMSQDDLLAHYRKISDSIDIPFVLYNIPQFANIMTVETLVEVVRTCGPVALKNSSPSVVEMISLLKALKATTVSYLVGPDELLFTGLELGASGSMSGLTGTVPEAVRALIDAHRAREIDEARRIQYALVELLDLIKDLPFPFAYKLMMAARGFEMGPPIHAQSSATQKRAEQAKQAVARKIQAIVKLVAP